MAQISPRFARGVFAVGSAMRGAARYQRCAALARPGFGGPAEIEQLTPMRKIRDELAHRKSAALRGKRAGRGLAKTADPCWRAGARRFASGVPVLSSTHSSFFKRPS